WPLDRDSSAPQGAGGRWAAPAPPEPPRAAASSRRLARRAPLPATIPAATLRNRRTGWATRLRVKAHFACTPRRAGLALERALSSTIHLRRYGASSAAAHARSHRAAGVSLE